MSLGRELTENDVGKIFRTRGGSKAEILNIVNGRTVIYMVHEDSDCDRIVSCNLYGVPADAEHIEQALVCEWLEPEIKLTAEDVGRRVKLRTGVVTLITAFSESQGYATTPRGAVTIAGLTMEHDFYNGFEDDIVELLD